MKQKRIISSFLAIIFLSLGIVFLSSCDKGKKTEKEIIKIGAILPLTGNLSYLGEPGKNVIQMLEEDMASNNLKIQLYDSQASPKMAISAFQKAVQIDKIKIFLTTLTGVSEAIKPLAKNEGVMQGIIAIFPKIAEDNPLTFQICYNAENEINEIIKYLGNNGYKKVFVFQSRDAISKIEIEEYLGKFAKENSIKLVVEEFDIGSKAFSDIVSKYISSNAEIGILLGYGSDFQGILKEIASRKIDDYKIIGGIGFLELPDYTTYEIVKNCVFTAPKAMIKGFENERFLAFKEKYKNRFNKEVTYDAAYTYDGLIAIMEAVNKLGSGDPNKISEFLLKNKIAGITGEIMFSTKGTLVTEVGLARFNKEMEMIEAK